MLKFKVSPIGRHSQSAGHLGKTGCRLALPASTQVPVEVDKGQELIETRLGES